MKLGSEGFIILKSGRRPRLERTKMPSCAAVWSFPSCFETALAALLGMREGLLFAGRESCYLFSMRREEALTRLKSHEADLRRLGVETLYLFGSTARDEAGNESDIDLFFDYEKGKLGLFELMDVKDFATRILGREADIMTRDSLHKSLRRQIEATALRVF